MTWEGRTTSFPQISFHVETPPLLRNPLEIPFGLRVSTVLSLLPPRAHDNYSPIGSLRPVPCSRLVFRSARSRTQVSNSVRVGCNRIDVLALQVRTERFSLISKTVPRVFAPSALRIQIEVMVFRPPIVWALLSLVFSPVVNGALDTSSLSPLLSSQASIDNSAPRWSEYAAPVPGAVVHVASEADVQATVRWICSPFPRYTSPALLSRFADTHANIT